MPRQILIVEDEPAVLQVALAVLRHAGYAVTGASSVKEAKAFLSAHGDLKDLILVVDVVLDDESGIAFAEQLMDQHPSYWVLLMSGFTDDVVMTRPEHASRVTFLRKPFTKQDLLTAVQAVSDAGSAGK